MSGLVEGMLAAAFCMDRGLQRGEAELIHVHMQAPLETLESPGENFVRHCNSFFFFLIFIYLFIYLFMAVLGLHFCARAFSSCGKWGPLFIAVRGPLTMAASLVAEHRLQTCRLSNCGSRA